jgi:hypothetical protein
VIFEKNIKNLDSYVVLLDDDKTMLKEKKNIESVVIENPICLNARQVSTLEQHRFIAAGQLCDRKGFDLLIKAFSIFAKSNDDWELLIYGVGPELKKLKKLAIKYCVDKRVVFCGNTDDMETALMEAGVFCLSSRFEGMAMVTLNALELGLPIIAFDIPAIRPVVDKGNNGYIVNCFDVEAYASAMSILANDEETRKRFGYSAKQKSYDFDKEKIVEKWYKIFD